MKPPISRNPTIKYSPIMRRSRKKFILKKYSCKEPLANTNFVLSGTPLKANGGVTLVKEPYYWYIIKNVNLIRSDDT